MSDDSVPRISSKFDDSRYQRIELEEAETLQNQPLTPESMRSNREAFDLIPDAEDFLIQLTNAMMRQEFQRAITLVHNFYARMHPPELSVNTMVSALPIATKAINALESCGFIKVSALLPLTEQELIHACSPSGCFGEGFAAEVTEALKPLREKFNRSKRIGLYTDLDDEVMEEVEAEKRSRRR